MYGSKSRCAGFGVEAVGGEALGVNVGQDLIHARVADAQQVQVGGVALVGVQHGDGVEGRAVVVGGLDDLRPVVAVDGRVEVAAGRAVVGPVRDGRHVARDGVQRHLRLVVVAEVAAPGVDLLLAGRVPGHLAAEGVAQGAPVRLARLHIGFQLIGLVVPALAAQVVDETGEDAADHQAELGQVSPDPTRTS